jgi:hypothetical protein
MPDVYVHNLGSMKSFHGVQAGNIYQYLLKTKIGKVRLFDLVEKRANLFFSRNHIYCLLLLTWFSKATSSALFNNLSAPELRII